MIGKALLVVDVQNCFLPGGSLGVPGGDEVVPVMNEYIKQFKQAGLPVFASRDWHPEVTKHFEEYGGKWPPHCVQGTEGAEFAPGLELPEDVQVISEGMDPNMEGYSVFEGIDDEGTSFEQLLREQGVTHLYIGGIATDYCVKVTALDALQRGFRVTLLLDAVRGVDVEPGDSQKAVEAMVSAGARIANLKDVAEELRIKAA